MTAAVASALASGADLSVGLPPTLTADTAPRHVAVSVSDGLHPARVAWGSGPGLAVALQKAVPALPRAAYAWLKIDVVTAAGTARAVNKGGAVGFERSLRGVALSVAGRTAFVLPEQLVARSIITRKGRLRGGALAQHLRDRGMQMDERRVVLQPFSTASWFRANAVTRSLYRGHRDSPASTSDRMLEVAKAAGAYLARSVRSTGQFDYSYLAKTDRVRSSYNMVRHAGTVYSMFELYEVTRDKALRVAGERAIAYLMARIVDYPKPGSRAAALFGEGKLKLGGAALAAVALAKHAQVTGDERSKRMAQRLCDYIVDSLDAKGRMVHSRDWPGGKENDFRSQYYDGEALLGLLRVYQLDGNKRWLDAAKRAARYLIEVRDKGVTSDNAVHDHWLLYALAELHRASPSPAYVAHSMLIARAIVMKQKKSADVPDHVGTYWNGPRSTPVATRTEGLVAALSVARSDSPADASAIEDTIRRNITFQLHTFVTPERALYLANPPRALGGFTRSLTNFEIRIDYVQHNISALLTWRRALLSPAR